jgi:hypothetical protein
MVDLLVLTSLDQLILYCKYYYFFNKTTNHNGEVICTEPSPKLVFPGLDILALSFTPQLLNLTQIIERDKRSSLFCRDGGKRQFYNVDLRFGIYVDDEEDHLIRSVTFTDTKGFLYGPYTSMSSLYDIINLKTVNFPVGEAPPFDDVRKNFYLDLE